MSCTLEEARFAVCEADTGEAALRVIRAHQPDLAILDVLLSGMSGYELCYELRAEGIDIPVLFISGERVQPLDRTLGLLLGGSDYLCKPFAPGELLARTTQLLADSGSKHSHPALTRREIEVLTLLSDGAHQKEIAAQLNVSPSTVGTHVEHILLKLGVHSQAQAVAIAYQDGILARRLSRVDSAGARLN